MERVKMPGTLDSLEGIGGYVMRAAAEAGLDQKAAYRLRLAVDEIATNIIVHGFEETGLEGDITIWSELDEVDLRVILEDGAPAFDPHQVALPSGMDLPLEDRAIGGLGVFLALRGVDELRYERIGDRNRNTFVVHRPVAQST